MSDFSAKGRSASSASALGGVPPLWLLVLLTFTGTLAMHMFVPALPDAGRDLMSNPSAMQATISLYVLGLALGQLVWGPLSDRWGRRPALLGGLALFTMASLVCMASSGLSLLVCARFVQGFGGAAGLLLGRAIVRDTATPQETMRRLAALSLVMMAGPGLAPLAGAVVVGAAHWRAVFLLFALLGSAGIVLAWSRLPETHPILGTGIRELPARSHFELLRSPSFLLCVTGGGCSTASFYAFVSAAPFLFEDVFGQSAWMVGLFLALLSSGLALGNVLATRLSRHPPLTLMRVANGLSLACCSLLLCQLTWFQPTLSGILATMFLYCIGAGLCSPVALSSALSIRADLTGSASGLYGAGQMAVGALCSAAVGMGEDVGVMAATVLVAACAVGQIAFQRLARHRPFSA